MTSREDTGFTADNLVALTWLLGTVSAAAWAIVAATLDNADGLDRGWGLSLGVAVVAAVWAVGCAVLAGVKESEARVAGRLEELVVAREAERGEG